MSRDVKNSRLLIIITPLIILAIAAATYFFIDKTISENQIRSIESAVYVPTTSEKGEQSGAPGLPVSVQTEQEQDPDGYIYQTPLGFPIVSYSDKWAGDKLKDIYNELLNNIHGDEIMYLSKIVVYPGESEIDSGGSVAGTHTVQLKDSSVFFNLPALFPSSLHYSIRSTLSMIELYNMDDYDTVEQAARTIAHEYGHHYTMHYFMSNDTEAKESGYYSLRNISAYGHEVFFDDQETYYQNHEWSIYEIAAEDYVQMMGSPNAKVARKYKDIYDVLLSGDDSYYPQVDETTVNVFPQENVYIPLADEMTGLRAYFYSFIGKEDTDEPLQQIDFGLKMTKRSNNGYTYYDITFNKTSTDEDALYTLMCYDSDGNPFIPVKTIYGDEEPVAKVGTVSRLKGTVLTTCTNEITNEDRYFKIYLLLPDGRMQSSSLYFADF